MSRERIARELARLQAGGLQSELVEGTLNNERRSFVVYRSVPTTAAVLVGSSGTVELPEVTDVIVPVPAGYPAAMIDLAGLPVESPLLRLVKGGQNNQGIVEAAGRKWQLASYHPHNGGGGPPWDQVRFGFHTYFDQVLAWLHRLN